MALKIWLALSGVILVLALFGIDPATVKGMVFLWGAWFVLGLFVAADSMSKTNEGRHP